MRPHHLTLLYPDFEVPLSPIFDDSGTALFGYFEPGHYSLKATLQNRAERILKFVVHPKEECHETIVCPPPISPVVTRQIVVPLAEALRKPGLRVCLDWECKYPESEKWSDWSFQRVKPFASLIDERHPEYFSDWYSLTNLSEITANGVARLYQTRPMLVRPTSARLDYKPTTPSSKIHELAESRMTDQPWIDLGKLDEEPIAITLPNDLLEEAEAELVKLNAPAPEEAAAPTPQ